MTVEKPVAELETFNKLFDSDLYKEYENKFCNPFHANCNNRRSHLKPNLRAKNGTHLLFHDRTSLLDIGFEYAEIRDRIWKAPGKSKMRLFGIKNYYLYIIILYYIIISLFFFIFTSFYFSLLRGFGVYNKIKFWNVLKFRTWLIIFK